MVKLRTVQGWGFSCLEYEVNDEGEVNKIICKICREFYSTEQEQKKLANKYKGSEKFLEQANAYVNDSSVVTTRLLLCVQKKNCRHIAAGSDNYGSIFVLPINLLNCEGWGHYTLNYGNGHLLIRLNSKLIWVFSNKFSKRGVRRLIWCFSDVCRCMNIDIKVELNDLKFETSVNL